MSGGVLSNLELGERKSERLDAPLQVEQSAGCDARAAMRLEAVDDEPQIAEELLGRGVGAVAA